ncbi:ATP synthase subunit e, mitochondrial [Schistocerca nitens]|uniref:ATP synthase subunit e, mitochondrial n=1 Tax=Schistocerca nitens TaxID=7011 RepID=UPI002117AFF2|nr:ATP synthase subunit e, mitochondrial [Schistocerca nitens]
MADLPPPVRVSPLIKFGRWSFLLAGVLYGASRQRSLSKKEAALREIEEKEKAIRDAKLKEEKARLSKIEMEELARAAGVQPEP